LPLKNHRNHKSQSTSTDSLFVIAIFHLILLIAISV